MLIALLAAALISAPPVNAPATPDAVFAVCFVDLHDNIAPEDQPFVRYLYAPDDSAPYPQLVDYSTNSTSFRSELAHTEQLGGRRLRIDLRSYGWDYPSRSKRLAELERRGVKFSFANSEERRLFLDPWEKLASLDPYYFSDSPGYTGWIDPGREKAARLLSRSTKFVLRADWVLPRLLLEKQFGGIYSDLLMFAAKEEDIFRGLLIDIKAINRDNQLRQGGAVLESIVALHNRGLEMLPSFYGQGSNRFHWQTYDTNVDARGDKSVLEAFAGTLKHDGRESIGSLPNGLLYFLLFNGKGEQAAVVPEEIAQVKKPLVTPVNETRVVNSYKCLECHGPANGIFPFDDVVRKAFLSPAAQLKAKSKFPNVADDVAAALEDYYNSSLSDTIQTQQQAYAARLKLCCGMTGREAAVAVVGAVESYLFNLVDPEAAAREQGYNLDFARLSWQASRNPQLAVLATGQPIRRAAFEQSFGDGMRAALELKRRLGKSAKSDPY